jgi:hypothetical protein
MDQKHFTISTHSGTMVNAVSDPEKVALVTPDQKDAYEQMASPLIKADRREEIANDAPIRVEGKLIYLVHRSALKPKADLMKEATRGKLASVQPVLTHKGDTVVWLGSFTATLGAPVAAGQAMMLLDEPGIKVVRREGLDLKCELTDWSRYRTVFEAAAALSRKKSVFRAVVPDVAGRVKR